MISNDIIKLRLARKNVPLIGEEGSPERYKQYEETRVEIWREKGFELVNGKWKKK